MPSRFVGSLAVVAITSMGAVADVPLSGYMGVPSGEVTSVSNPPYMEVVTPAEYGGFGADRAGTFAMGPIAFNDQGEQAHGIGAHPVSRLEFDLESIRAENPDEPLNFFRALAGIDEGGGGPGAEFNVYVDGELKASVKADAVLSVRISANIDGASTLALETKYVSCCYNWACWGEALLKDCYPDFAPDGMLDLFDFLAFVNAFNAGQEVSDCTGDGAFDLFDFLCFVNSFNTGC